jgi:uncharacterized membrane protein
MSALRTPARPRPTSGPRPPALARARADRLADAAAVTAPALLALGLCLYGMGARSLGFDEGATVAIASQHGSALGHAIAHDGGNMSAYYLLLHLLISAFGDALWVIRAPSAVATALTVALTALLALRRFDRRVALVAGALAALSLPLVFWGQSARGYAPMVALTTGSFVAFEALLERRGRPRAAWPAYVACTMLAVYAGFVAVSIVPAQLLVLTGRRRALKPVLSALAAAAACCFPLVVLAASRGSGQLFWVPRPSLTADRQVLESLASAGLAPSFHTTPAALVLLCLTAVVLAGLAWTRPQRTGLLFAWLVVPVAVAWLESVVGQPVFMARNLLSVLPAVAILLAVALTGRRLAQAALLAAVVALRVVPLAAAYGVSSEDWKSATAYVLARTAPADCIAFYPSDGHMAFAYYVPAGAGATYMPAGAGATDVPGGARAPRSILPRAAWATPPRPFVENYASLSESQIRQAASTCRRLWLVSSHQGQPDGPAGARANLARFGRLRGALEAQYPRRRTVTFGYAATITVELLTDAASSPRTSGS